MKKSLFFALFIAFLSSCKDDTASISPVVTPPTTVVPTVTSLGDSLYLHKSDFAIEYRTTAADFNDWNTNKANKTTLIKKIYNRFADDFDFIFIVLNNETLPAQIGYYGAFSSVRNDIKGLGMNIYNTTAQYGSAGKLKGTMIFSARSYIKFGPTLHELAHAYANFAVPTYSIGSDGKQIDYLGHWGISDAGGQLGGFRPEYVTANLDGVANKYQAGLNGLGQGFGANANGGNSVRYSKIELYLMGLIPKTEVPPLKVYSGLSIPANETRKGVFMATNVKTYTIDNIIAMNGERVPNNTTSQKEFKALTVVVTDHTLSDTEWATVNENVDWFSRPVDDGTTLYNYYAATEGRSTIKMNQLKNSVKK